MYRGLFLLPDGGDLLSRPHGRARVISPWSPHPLAAAFVVSCRVGIEGERLTIILIAASSFASSLKLCYTNITFDDESASRLRTARGCGQGGGAPWR